MLQEKAGELAGRIWASLNENGAQSLKEIKKTAKINEKDFYLAIGWLLREDKLETEQDQDGEIIFSLK